MKKIVLIISFLMISYSVLVYAWDGYDHDADDYIEIINEDSVVPGNDIEIYDYSDESRHTVHVISINNTGNEAEIKVYDFDEGEYRTFYMDTDTDDQRTDISSA